MKLLMIEITTDITHVKYITRIFNDSILNRAVRFLNSCPFPGDFSLANAARAFS